MNQQENTGYSFDSNEQFSWDGKQLRELHYQKILEGFASLKDLFEHPPGNDDPENTILLDTMSEVLESLERTFVHHFQTRTGHIFSPKSDEPWD